MAFEWLRLKRAHLIGWWRARPRKERRAPSSPPPTELQATDLAPAFTALSYFFRPAALIAGALYVHERVEQRRRIRRARIAWAIVLALLLATQIAWLAARF
jgi:hypothetical protein